MHGFVCLAVMLTLLPHTTINWKQDRRPLVYGDRLSRKTLYPIHKLVQRKLVVYHNFFRSKVQPPASNMLSMTWHKHAARAAQNWAEQCQHLTHDNASGRWIDSYGSCGQNIFISTHKVPWYFAIKTWFLERKLFIYGGSHNLLEEVGHYTQLVWAASHKMGCGFAECHEPSKGWKKNKYFIYVCNYCPIGNHLERLNQPYKRGLPCSGCPGSCNSKKLCTNSCPAGDHWANCEELHSTWPGWLCEGKERKHHCRATCTCDGKVT